MCLQARWSGFLETRPRFTCLFCCAIGWVVPGTTTWLWFQVRPLLGSGRLLLEYRQMSTVVVPRWTTTNAKSLHWVFAIPCYRNLVNCLSIWLHCLLCSQNYSLWVCVSQPTAWSIHYVLKCTMRRRQAASGKQNRNCSLCLPQWISFVVKFKKHPETGLP